MPRRTPTRSRRKTWSGSPCLTGDDAWRSAADRLFDGILPLAAENLFGHMALLNALDLRLRAAEIVVTGTGPTPTRLAAAPCGCPSSMRIVRAGRRVADALAAAHPARDKIAATPGRRLRLPRRTLLAAGDEPDQLGADCRRVCEE